ncbi:MAG: hypothetical protein JWN96_2177, partial [Mycobacterium sp.]|nr:hypothetical protein [Mycobacterium sp.]
MFDVGGIAAKVAQAAALVSDVIAAISSETSGPAAQEALLASLELSGQTDLLTCLLSERVDRTGQFAADNAVSMASWLRNQAHSSHKWAFERVTAGRALVDTLPATRAAWSAGALTLEHVTV